MFNTDNYVDFVLITPMQQGYSFSSYSDSDGKICYLADPSGKKFFVNFGEKERIYRVSKNLEKINQDGKKQKVHDYISKAPFVKGSPNENGYFIEKVDNEASAEQALDNKTRRIKAEQSVLDMSEEEVASIAPIFGIFEKTPKQRQYGLLRIAENSPDAFFEVYDRQDKDILSVVRKALRKNVLVKRGTTIYWGEECLGTDENESISKLQKNPKIVEGIAKQTESFEKD